MRRRPIVCQRPGKFWLLALLLILLIVGGGGTAFFLLTNKREPPPENDLTKPPQLPAEELARQVHKFCGACHAYPPPDSFPRSAWKEEVERGFHFFGKSTLLRINPPPIDQVIRYYENQAPQALPPLPTVPHLVKGGPGGKKSPCAFARLGIIGPPNTSPPAISNINLVNLSDPKRLDILACEMRFGLVMALQASTLRASLKEGDNERIAASWQILGKVDNPAHVEVVDLDGDGIKDLLVADLGSFTPADRLCGRVVWLRGQKEGGYTPITLLKNVGRVADVQAADFNGDGKLDLVVGVFGWQETGEIIVLENRTTDWRQPVFEPHVVDPRHGTIHVPVIDLNGDGKPDFVALIAQEHEEVAVFLNEGNFRFRREKLYTAPHPAYGSSGIQLVDLDKDGLTDVLYTNGDVLDEPHLLKPYHGVQWLRNPGKGRFPFEHRPLAAMYGVHRAVAGDIDGDGDLDIVAVSYLPKEYFPQRQELNLDSIMWLEQVAPGRFVQHTLEKRSCDHVTCALGDLFGSGRLDLVTAQFTLDEKAESLLILRNLGTPK